MIETDNNWCLTKAIVPIVHDEMKRAVPSLSIKEKKEFVILTRTKVVSLVPKETPTRLRFMTENALSQGMNKSGRCYTPEDWSNGGKKKDQGKRPIREGKAGEFWRKIQPKDYSMSSIRRKPNSDFCVGLTDEFVDI